MTDSTKRSDEPPTGQPPVGAQPRTKPRKLGRILLIVIAILMVGPLVASLFLRAYVVEAFKVPAGSMMPTLMVGDHIFATKYRREARRGEVFVFRYPENPEQSFVKRVVATSGDTLEAVDGRRAFVPGRAGLAGSRRVQRVASRRPRALRGRSEALTANPFRRPILWHHAPVSGVLGTVFAFPTVVFTVLLIVAVVYWLFVLVGAVDLDGHDGATEGLAGASKGAMEGGLKGALEAKAGIADGAADGAHEGLDLDVPDAGLLASLVSVLRLRSAPVTVVFSLFALFGWLGSALAMTSFGNALPFPGWLTGIPVLLVSGLFSLILTSIAIRPIAPVFATRHARTHNNLIGRVVVVSTGDVDEKFGQATLEDGGAGLILQVRAEARLQLRRGDRCLVVDVESGAFRLERMTDVLADPGAPANAELRREARAEVEAALIDDQAAIEAEAARRRARS